MDWNVFVLQNCPFCLLQNCRQLTKQNQNAPIKAVISVLSVDILSGDYKVEDRLKRLDCKGRINVCNKCFCFLGGFVAFRLKMKPLTLCMLPLLLLFICQSKLVKNTIQHFSSTSLRRTKMIRYSWKQHESLHLQLWIIAHGQQCWACAAREEWLISTDVLRERTGMNEWIKDFFQMSSVCSWKRDKSSSVARRMYLKYNMCSWWHTAFLRCAIVVWKTCEDQKLLSQALFCLFVLWDIEPKWSKWYVVSAVCLLVVVDLCVWRRHTHTKHADAKLLWKEASAGWLAQPNN